MTEPTGAFEENEPASREEAVLVQWFLAYEEGETPDLDALCGGDRELALRVRAILEREPSALQMLGSGSRAEALRSDDPEGVGEFEFLKLLGRGGMGAVYLARQASPARKVAVKVLHRGELADARARLRFEREANLAAALNHPNIVPIYAVGDRDGLAYIAMKRLRGPGLDRLGLPLAPRAAAALGVKIANALEEAHLCGIVHRDVKPSNILLDGDEPVLVDFGLARATTDVTLTREGNVAGTLPYLAPELLEGGSGASLDPRVDVYGLGATLYELVRGAPLFSGVERQELFAQVLFKEPVPLRLKGAERDFETIVAKAIEKDPARRIASAGLLARELERFLAGEPIELKPVGWGGRLVRRARRHPRVALGAFLALLALLIVLALAIRSSGRRERLIDQRLVLVREELERGAWARGETLLADLDAERGDVGEMAALVRAEKAAARFFDEVFQLPTPPDRVSLRTWRDEALASNAVGRYPRLLPLALVLATWHEEGAEAARASLASTGPHSSQGRARDALEELLRSADAEERKDSEGLLLPEDEPDTDADEHVLTATALFLAGRPMEEFENEIELALAADSGNARARLVWAEALAAKGRHARAFDVLGTLRSERAETPGFRLSVARALEWMGRPEAARAELERIPRERWGPGEAAVDLALCLRAQDWPVFEERLERYKRDLDEGRLPAGWELLRLEAAYLYQTGSFGPAVELLERVRNDADDVVNRELATAVRYLMFVDAALAARGTGVQPPADPGELRFVGSRLLRQLRLARAKGIVAWKYGELLLSQGEARGLQKLADARGWIPDNVSLRVVYAGSLLNVADGRASEGRDEAARYLEERAAIEARRLLDELGDPFEQLSGEDALRVLELVRTGAERVSDLETLVRALELLSREDPRAAQRARYAHELEEARGARDSALED